MILPKGEMKRRTREAIENLGINCTLSEAKRFLRKKYSSENLSDSTFYNLRKEIRKQGVSFTSELVPNSSVQSERSKVNQMVKAAKALITTLGKEEAKELIDLL